MKLKTIVTSIARKFEGEKESRSMKCTSDVQVLCDAQTFILPFAFPSEYRQAEQKF